MRRVVHGKLYDTEKSELLHWWENGLDYSDFRSVDEALYRTASGAYFLAGSGGPGTHYAKRVGSNSWTSGSGIRTISKDEAMSWLEAHDGTEALLDYFAEELEDDREPSLASTNKGTRLVHNYRHDYTGQVEGGVRAAGWCRVRIYRPSTGGSQASWVVVLSDPEVLGYDGPAVSDNFKIIVAEVLTKHELSVDKVILIDHTPEITTVTGEEYFDLVTFSDADPKDATHGKLGEPSWKPLDRRTVEEIVGIEKEL